MGHDRGADEQSEVALSSRRHAVTAMIEGDEDPTTRVRWTWNEVATGCALIADRLSADFATAQLPTIGYLVPRLRPDDPFLTCGAQRLPIWIGGGIEAACWFAASQLLERVDHTWSRLHDRRAVQVRTLSLPTDVPAIAHWLLDGEPLCAIGHLVPSCAASMLDVEGL